MSNKLFKKGLVVGIIVLFIVIGFKPVLSNEIVIPKLSYNEEDCNCNIHIGKLHLAEKLLNRLEKNEEALGFIVCKKILNNPFSKIINPAIENKININSIKPSNSTLCIIYLYIRTWHMIRYGVVANILVALSIAGFDKLFDFVFNNVLIPIALKIVQCDIKLEEYDCGIPPIW